MEGTVLAVWRWPVRGMGGERTTAVRVDRRGVGGDRIHAVVAGQQPLDALDGWSAAYPFNPGAKVDPASPPYAIVTSPSAHSYRWGDPRLRAALEDALGHAVEMRRDMAYHPGWLVLAGAGAPATAPANVRVDVELAVEELTFAGGVRVRLLEAPHDGVARARPIVNGRIAQGDSVSA